MRVLVTGASGFAGSHLVEALVSAGYNDVFGTVFGGNEYLSQYLPKEHIIPIDLSKKEEVDALIEKVKPDHIYHLAAFAFVGKSFEKGTEILTNNITLQFNLLEAVRQFAPTARMLIIGSAEEYGVSEAGELPINESHPLRPVNPYAVSKVTQDLLAYSYFISYKLNIVRARPFNHIGERQTEEFAIPAFAKQIVEIERGKQESLRVGNLMAIRDFTDVQDMMRAYMLLMEKGQAGEVYNIGSEVGISMEKIVQQLIALSGTPVKIEQDRSRMRPHDIPEIVADASKIKSLGWSTTISLADSLKRVLEYWRAQ